MREEPDYLVVGHVEKPHGIEGEVYVRLLTDHPEDVFRPGVILRMGASDSNTPDPDRPPLRITAVRPFRTGVLVCFGGVASRDDADTLRDLDLMQQRRELAPLEEGELWFHEVVGAQVDTVAGDEVGEVIAIFDLEPVNLIEVRRPNGRTLLIPFRAEIVTEVDREGGRIVIDPPEGLLELEDS